MTRQERIDTLCAEINRLTVCHTSLPPGNPRRKISQEISARLEEINRLNSPSVVQSPRGQHVAYTSAVVMVLCGLLIGAYGLVSFGALVGFFALVVLDGAPDH